MRKILLSALVFMLIFTLAGCNPPENKETETTTVTTTTTTTTAATTTAETTAPETTTTEVTVSETTTSILGGFVVYDELPEDGDSWEELGE